MPNLPVDMDSWERLACYPQGSFYPLSDGPSTRHHRITKPDFRPCSTCPSRSQAPFCLYTLRAISVRSEGTFGRLRYSLGRRPPQSNCPPKTVRPVVTRPVRNQLMKGWYPNNDSSKTGVLGSTSPTYPVHSLTKFNLRLQ